MTKKAPEVTNKYVLVIYKESDGDGFSSQLEYRTGNYIEFLAEWLKVYVPSLSSYEVMLFVDGVHKGVSSTETLELKNRARELWNVEVRREQEERVRREAERLAEVAVKIEAAEKREYERLKKKFGGTSNASV